MAFRMEGHFFVQISENVENEVQRFQSLKLNRFHNRCLKIISLIYPQAKSSYKFVKLSHNFQKPQCLPW